jgi:hypothetical protein
MLHVIIHTHTNVLFLLNFGEEKFERKVPILFQNLKEAIHHLEMIASSLAWGNPMVVFFD